ncbi:hypothetical protein DICSQDRAFT_169068 [Dichomitus squalens LYAD-421 SS1]|uniref:uncharacterized protein n=1 Tax=Dichomitus squalens (strain LYAD-421) TaxID=732165 RepID=UPI000441584E|nr:uncharacterized protein DICSQDRAFT_169068 [Dichomitus squalens LYAD-421 SS1]EJF62679.1 hypothetical protein DICSQDRAFT_169068 [Dichomitus squalens LYAD-421 SS1]
MSFRYTLSSPSTLRLCVICGLSPSDGIKLMKCNGCVDPPTYCSKECQKAHWPTHKASCQYISNKRMLANRPCSLPDELHGFATLQDLTQAFSDYLSAHEWALETVTKISTLLRFKFGRREQPDNAVLRFRFSRSSPAGNPNGNPACTFTFLRTEWLDETDPRKIDILTASRANGLAQFRRSCPPIVRSPDGAVLALFTLDGSVHNSLQSFPWYRPDPGGIASLGSHLDLPLEELTKICLRSLNTELPFRAPSEGVGQLQLPVPGRYKRIRKQWVWEPLFTDWVDYIEGRTQCSPLVVLEGLTMKPPPQDLMLLYYNI